MIKINLVFSIFWILNFILINTNDCYLKIQIENVLKTIVFTNLRFQEFDKTVLHFLIKKYFKFIVTIEKFIHLKATFL